MKVEAAIHSLLEPLFEVLPLEQAMPALVPSRPGAKVNLDQVTRLIQTPEIQVKPLLGAALWLYVDDIDQAHRICQDDPSSFGAIWHGVVHRREGDFWNSRYWFRRVGPDSEISGEELVKFVDVVEKHATTNPRHLLDAQRQEWVRLFELTAQRYGI